MKLLFRSPSSRLFSTSIHSSVTFNPRGVNLSPTRIRTQITRTTRVANVAPLLPQLPRRLSNNRGRVITVTKLLTVAPGVLLYSRPATDLSLHAHHHLVRFLHGSARALLVSSRSLRFILRIYSHILLVSRNHVVTSNLPGIIVNGRALVRQRNLRGPRSLVPRRSPRRN